MEFSVDRLATISQEEVEHGADAYMKDLLLSNPDSQNYLTLPDSTQVMINSSSVSFIPLYGSSNKQRILALFSPTDPLTAVALYLLDRWWVVNDILKTGDAALNGAVQVETVRERIVLYILNRVIYRAKEISSDDFPFLCHEEKDYAKILWNNGEAVGFYSVKLPGSVCNSFFTRTYELPVMDTIFVRKCQRGKGFGLQMLEDFVLSFKDDCLGLRCPLSTSMYKVCEKYLCQYPADRDLLWEVQSVGQPNQRTNIANKIQALDLNTVTKSLTFAEESITTQIEEAESEQRTVEIMNEVTVLSASKEAESPVVVCVGSGSKRRNIVERITEDMPEKVIRIEDVEAETPREKASAHQNRKTHSYVPVQTEGAFIVVPGKKGKDVVDTRCKDDAATMSDKPTAVLASHDVTPAPTTGTQDMNNTCHDSQIQVENVASELEETKEECQEEEEDTEAQDAERVLLEKTVMISPKRKYTRHSMKIYEEPEKDDEEADKTTEDVEELAATEGDKMEQEASGEWQEETPVVRKRGRPSKHDSKTVDETRTGQDSVPSAVLNTEEGLKEVQEDEKKEAVSAMEVDQSENVEELAATEGGETEQDSSGELQEETPVVRKRGRPRKHDSRSPKTVDKTKEAISEEISTRELADETTEEVEELAATEGEETEQDSSEELQEETPVVRKRGRPRKHDSKSPKTVDKTKEAISEEISTRELADETTEEVEELAATEGEEMEQEETPVVRKRGRPSKHDSKSLKAVDKTKEAISEEISTRELADETTEEVEELAATEAEEGSSEELQEETPVVRKRGRPRKHDSKSPKTVDKTKEAISEEISTRELADETTEEVEELAATEGEELEQEETPVVRKSGRPRKHDSKSPKPVDKTEEISTKELTSAEGEETEQDLSGEWQKETPVVRKRGRPSTHDTRSPKTVDKTKKAISEEISTRELADETTGEVEELAATEGEEMEQEETPVVRKRGRPRKHDSKSPKTVDKTKEAISEEISKNELADETTEEVEELAATEGEETEQGSSEELQEETPVVRKRGRPRKHDSKSPKTVDKTEEILTKELTSAEGKETEQDLSGKWQKETPVVRKRGRPSKHDSKSPKTVDKTKKATSEEISTRELADETTGEVEELAATEGEEMEQEETSVVRKRGRPRKHDSKSLKTVDKTKKAISEEISTRELADETTEEVEELAAIEGEEMEQEDTPVVRKRGRPRKHDSKSPKTVEKEEEILPSAVLNTEEGLKAVQEDEKKEAVSAMEVDQSEEADSMMEDLIPNEVPEDSAVGAAEETLEVYVCPDISKLQKACIVLVDIKTTSYHPSVKEAEETPADGACAPPEDEQVESIATVEKDVSSCVAEENASEPEAGKTGRPVLEDIKTIASETPRQRSQCDRTLEEEAEPPKTVDKTKKEISEEISTRELADETTEEVEELAATEGEEMEQEGTSIVRKRGRPRKHDSKSPKPVDKMEEILTKELTSAEGEETEQDLSGEWQKETPVVRKRGRPRKHDSKSPKTVDKTKEAISEEISTRELAEDTTEEVEELAATEGEETEQDSSGELQEETPVVRKRGRPSKHDSKSLKTVDKTKKAISEEISTRELADETIEEVEELAAIEGEEMEQEDTPVVRKRGRPRKHDSKSPKTVEKEEEILPSAVLNTEEGLKEVQEDEKKEAVSAMEVDQSEEADSMMEDLIPNEVPEDSAGAAAEETLEVYVCPDISKLQKACIVLVDIKTTSYHPSVKEAEETPADGACAPPEDEQVEPIATVEKDVSSCVAEENASEPEAGKTGRPVLEEIKTIASETPRQRSQCDRTLEEEAEPPKTVDKTKKEISEEISTRELADETTEEVEELAATEGEEMEEEETSVVRKTGRPRKHDSKSPKTVDKTEEILTKELTSAEGEETEQDLSGEWQKETPVVRKRGRPRKHDSKSPKTVDKTKEAISEEISTRELAEDTTEEVEELAATEGEETEQDSSGELQEETPVVRKRGRPSKHDSKSLKTVDKTKKAISEDISTRELADETTEEVEELAAIEGEEMEQEETPVVRKRGRPRKHDSKCPKTVEKEEEILPSAVLNTEEGLKEVQEDEKKEAVSAMEVDQSEEADSMMEDLIPNEVPEDSAGAAAEETLEVYVCPDISKLKKACIVLVDIKTTSYHPSVKEAEETPADGACAPPEDEQVEPIATVEKDVSSCVAEENASEPEAGKTGRPVLEDIKTIASETPRQRSQCDRTLEEEAEPPKMVDKTEEEILTKELTSAEGEETEQDLSGEWQEQTPVVQKGGRPRKHDSKSPTTVDKSRTGQDILPSAVLNTEEGLKEVQEDEKKEAVSAMEVDQSEEGDSMTEEPIPNEVLEDSAVATAEETQEVDVCPDISKLQKACIVLVDLKTTSYHPSVKEAEETPADGACAPPEDEQVEPIATVEKDISSCVVVGIAPVLVMGKTDEAKQIVAAIETGEKEELEDNSHEEKKEPLDDEKGEADEAQIIKARVLRSGKKVVKTGYQQQQDDNTSEVIMEKKEAETDTVEVEAEVKVMTKDAVVVTIQVEEKQPADSEISADPGANIPTDIGEEMSLEEDASPVATRSLRSGTKKITATPRHKMTGRRKLAGEQDTGISVEEEPAVTTRTLRRGNVSASATPTGTITSKQVHEDKPKEAEECVEETAEEEDAVLEAAVEKTDKEEATEKEVVEKIMEEAVHERVEHVGKETKEGNAMADEGQYVVEQQLEVLDETFGENELEISGEKCDESKEVVGGLEVELSPVAVTRSGNKSVAKSGEMEKEEPVEVEKEVSDKEPMTVPEEEETVGGTAVAHDLLQVEETGTPLPTTIEESTASAKGQLSQDMVGQPSDLQTVTVVSEGLKTSHNELLEKAAVEESVHTPQVGEEQQKEMVAMVVEIEKNELENLVEEERLGEEAGRKQDIREEIAEETAKEDEDKGDSDGEEVVPQTRTHRSRRKAARAKMPRQKNDPEKMSKNGKEQSVTSDNATEEAVTTQNTVEEEQSPSTTEVALLIEKDSEDVFELKETTVVETRALRSGTKRVRAAARSKTTNTEEQQEDTAEDKAAVETRSAAATPRHKSKRTRSQCQTEEDGEEENTQQDEETKEPMEKVAEEPEGSEAVKTEGKNKEQDAAQKEENPEENEQEGAAIDKSSDTDEPAVETRVQRKRRSAAATPRHKYKRTRAQRQTEEDGEEENIQQDEETKEPMEKVAEEPEGSEAEKTEGKNKEEAAAQKEENPEENEQHAQCETEEEDVIEIRSAETQREEGELGQTSSEEKEEKAEKSVETGLKDKEVQNAESAVEQVKDALTEKAAVVMEEEDNGMAAADETTTDIVIDATESHATIAEEEALVHSVVVDEENSAVTRRALRSKSKSLPATPSRRSRIHKDPVETPQQEEEIAEDEETQEMYELADDSADDSAENGELHSSDETSTPEHNAEDQATISDGVAEYQTDVSAASQQIEDGAGESTSDTGTVPHLAPETDEDVESTGVSQEEAEPVVIGKRGLRGRTVSSLVITPQLRSKHRSRAEDQKSDESLSNKGMSTRSAQKRKSTEVTSARRSKRLSRV